MKKLFFVFIIATCFVFSNVNAYSFGRSTYESHHIYPQRNFGHFGDDKCIELREFEHRWIEKTKTVWNIDQDKSLSDDERIYDNVNRMNFFERKTALITGLRVLSYHFITVNHNKPSGDGQRDFSNLLCAEFDLWGNLYYNLGYIFSLPAKLIHFYWDYFTNSYKYENYSTWWIIGWGLFEAILGFFSACVMTVVGPIVGFICHPLWSLSGLLVSINHPFDINFVTSIWNLLLTFVKGLWYIVVW